MEASWPVALAACSGASAILVGDAYGVRYLLDLPPWLFSTAFLIAVFSGAIVVVAIIQWCLRALHKFVRWRGHQKQIAAHLGRLRALPENEIEVLFWAAQHGRQVFLTNLNHPRVEPLLAKGYLQLVAGTHDVLDWPYKIPDHVWDFLATDMATDIPEDQIEYPFGRRWP